ncbi:MAG: hypothetical protein WBW28_13910, partial [Pseudolabrys sp.]
MRTVLAISVATLIFASGSGKVMAMVVAPLPAGLTTNHVTPASWNRCWRDSRGRLHCRRCSRDGWGGVR